MIELKKNTCEEYTKFICEHLDLSDVYFYFSKHCEYTIKIENKELLVWIDWWGHTIQFPKNKIQFKRVEIQNINKKSFTVYYEFEKYKGTFRLYIPFHCPEGVRNKLQNKLNEEVIKHFYLDNRGDIINFEITNRRNNEK